MSSNILMETLGMLERHLLIVNVLLVKMGIGRFKYKETWYWSPFVLIPVFLVSP